ncbi:DUF3360 family protein, partial [Neisseria sicca]|uniref:DUF3360 family protein n=1 Tax=Neisseria sicca TaxID=490 RepID=UPI0011BCF611
VFGWSLRMVLDKLGLMGWKEGRGEVGFMGGVVVGRVGFVILWGGMGGVGMVGGIAAFVEEFRNVD